MGDFLALVSAPAESPRPDRRADKQIAKHRPKPESLPEKNRDHGGGEIDECLPEHLLQCHGPVSYKPRRIRTRPDISQRFTRIRMTFDVGIQ